jgi:hypothetical protein
MKFKLTILFLLFSTLAAAQQFSVVVTLDDERKLRRIYEDEATAVEVAKQIMEQGYIVLHFGGSRGQPERYEFIPASRFERVDVQGWPESLIADRRR